MTTASEASRGIPGVSQGYPGASPHSLAAAQRSAPANDAPDASLPKGAWARGITPRPDREHALYRFYDESGDLLYVGITADVGARWKRHSKDKPWWTDVRTCTVEPHPDRDAVLAAEKAAIIAEQPRHNVQHVRHTASSPQPRPPADRIKTEADRTPGSNWINTVGAFGMADGTCPVGLVIDHDATGLTLDLFSWLSGYFSAGTRRIAIGQLRQFCVAFPLSDREAERRGYVTSPGEVIWDMEPLGEFQSAWKANR